MTETFVNPRTGLEEDVEYLCNPTGQIVSISPDHLAVRVLRGGGDKGERLTYANFRYATNAEILRYRRHVERVG